MGVITRGLVTKSIVAPAQAIYYVGKEAASNPSTGALGVVIPAGTTPGDLMIALVTTGSASAGTWTPPAGWTEVIDQGASPNLTVAWKIAVASDISATWSSTLSSIPIGLHISTFRNALIDVVGAVSPVVTGTNNIVIPSITTTVNNALVIALAVSGNATGNTVPTNYTQLWSTSGNPTGTAVFTRLQPIAGVSGTATMNWTSGTGNAAGVLVSIKPK
jgi:hypothetical protein